MHVCVCVKFFILIDTNLQFLRLELINNIYLISLLCQLIFLQPGMCVHTFTLQIPIVFEITPPPNIGGKRQKCEGDRLF